MNPAVKLYVVNTDIITNPAPVQITAPASVLIG